MSRYNELGYDVLVRHGCNGKFVLQVSMWWTAIGPLRANSREYRVGRDFRTGTGLA
jgi:hypothetical protein